MTYCACARFINYADVLTIINVRSYLLFSRSQTTFHLETEKEGLAGLTRLRTFLQLTPDPYLPKYGQR